MHPLRIVFYRANDRRTGGADLEHRVEIPQSDPSTEPATADSVAAKSAHKAVARPENPPATANPASSASPTVRKPPPAQEWRSQLRLPQRGS